MFGFFNKWKRAGKGVGITGGAGKLCAFDADGNVVSAGVSAADVGGKLYEHHVQLVSSGMTAGQADLILDFTLLSRSSAPLNTYAKVRDALPQSKTIAVGSFYYDQAQSRFPAIYIYRYGSGSSARMLIETYLATAMQLPPDYEITAADELETPVDTVREL
jgi:hypothetical protein